MSQACLDRGHNAVVREVEDEELHESDPCNVERDTDSHGACIVVVTKMLC